MADKPDLTDAIADVAAGPLKAANSAGSAENHNLRDMVEADKHLARKKSARNPFACLKRMTIRNPGAA